MFGGLRFEVEVEYLICICENNWFAMDNRWKVDRKDGIVDSDQLVSLIIGYYIIFRSAAAWLWPLLKRLMCCLVCSQEMS